MRRDRAFTQVQLEYEQLRRTHSHLSHKELWQQAEEAAASDPTAFDESDHTVERPPRWPVAMTSVSGAAAIVLFAWLGFHELDSDLTGAVAGNRDYESTLLRPPDLVTTLALVAWIGVLVGVAGIAATNRSARFGAFVGASAWLIVSIFVWSLTLLD